MWDSTMGHEAFNKYTPNAKGGISGGGSGSKGGGGGGGRSGGASSGCSSSGKNGGMETREGVGNGLG